MTTPSSPPPPPSPDLHEQLDRRCALFALAAMAAATVTGLLAWGPIQLTLPAQPLTRSSWGSTLIELVALCVPLVGVSAWGWHALSRTGKVLCIRRPWRWQFVWLAFGALLTAVHLVAPHELWRLLGQGAAVAALLLLSCGLLAERVHRAWGSMVTCAAVSGLALLAVGLSWLSASGGQPLDLRPLCLLALLPLLLMPAGVLRLPARCTSARDARLMLVLHGVAWSLTVGCALLSPGLDGTLGVQVLAHLSLAAAAGVLAYRTGAAALPPADDLTQANTSFST